MLVEVALPGVPLLLTYRTDHPVHCGTRVSVPLRGKARSGFVWQIHSSAPQLPARVLTVQPVILPLPTSTTALPGPVDDNLYEHIWTSSSWTGWRLPDAMVRFLAWAARYYGQSVGMLLRQTLPSFLTPDLIDGCLILDTRAVTEVQLRRALVRLGNPWLPWGALTREQRAVQSANPGGPLLRLPLEREADELGGSANSDNRYRLTAAASQARPRGTAQKEAFVLMERLQGASLRELEQCWKNPGTAVKGLIRKGLVRGTTASIVVTGFAPVDPQPVPFLSPDQIAAWQQLRDLPDCHYQPVLLQGVTGSGKTELYVHLIDAVLAAGGQALLLAPEIGIATQLYQRLCRRFLGRVALFHSDLGQPSRRRAVEQAASGTPLLLIGARSSLFVPLPRLRLIIVDEEHEEAYKAPDDPYLHGRNLAIKMAQETDCAVVLGSATPSPESWQQARNRRYRHVRLDHSFAAKKLTLNIVPGCDRRRSLLADPVQDHITAALERGEQVAILKNRRGRFRFLSCPNCSWQADCPNCDLPLVEHRHPRPHLTCHVCGHSTALPDRCPGCGGVSLHHKGEGTQHWEERVQKLWPAAEVVRIDGDLAGGYDRWQNLYTRIAQGRGQVLVGTQMIAKGFDLPNLHTMVLTDVDLLLNIPEIRAWERGFSLLVQAAGRVGRRAVEGTVWIETDRPDHPVLKAVLSADVNGFLEQECQRRKLAGFPPGRRAANLIFESPDRPDSDATRGTLARFAKTCPGVDVLGPVEDTIDRRNNRYIMTALALATDVGVLHRFCESVRRTGWPGTTVVRINYDPQNFG